MTRHLSFPALGAGVLLLAIGCGDGTSGTPGGSGGSGGGNTGACPENLGSPADAEFCAGVAATTDCKLVTGAYKSRVCGVPVRDPAAELSRSANVKEFSGSGPPDLSCFDAATYPPKADPTKSQMVKVSGIAKIFSHGCESKGLKIELFKVKRTGGSDEADLGEAIGSAVTTATECKTTGVATDQDDCGTRYECKYEYDNVPTETEFVVKTSGDLWAPLYDYNLYISNAAVQGGGWNHDVRALAVDDYSVIAQVAIGTSITPGNGAIAGEVHDCGDVRLIGATVDTEVQRKIVTYFTNEEEHPLPDLSAAATTSLGLYAALDVAPGIASVAAMGLVGGKLTTVGYLRVRVFPDSVTAVTFRGLRPFQVP